MLLDEAMHLATQLQNDGKLEQAEIILNRILATNSSHAYALHLLGIIAYQVGKITLAIQLIEQAIQSNPNVALFHSNLGEMHRKLKATHLSIQYGQYAVLLDPTSATALSNLGIAYYDAKQYEQAEQCHKRALRIDPRLSCSLNNMGSIYKAKNQTKQAIAFYQAAISVSPNLAEPLNNLGAVFLQQQEFKQAFDCLSRAILLAPDFADAHCSLGLALLGLDQSENALIYFEKALQLKSDYAEAYFGFAKVYLHQHHFIESERYVRKAMMIDPQQIEFYKLLAEIYHQQGNYVEALRQLDYAVSKDSTLSHLYISKGNVLMEMGEISKAEEQFLKVTSDPVKDARVSAHYCLVQLRKIKREDSSFHDLLSMANDVQDISPSKLAYCYFALGKCYDDIGEWAAAFEFYNQGCRLKRKRISYNIAEQIQFTDKLIKCITPKTIEYLKAFANPSAVPIFIVGMPRSGSTLVEQVLSSHSQVYGAGELKYLTNLIQLHYPENMLQLSPEICRTIADDYVSYLQRFSPDAIRITDKMPHNFIAIGLIHALLPNAKIIHVKRNPIDTCLSCYTNLFTEGQLYSYDLTELGQYYQCYERIMNHWRHILPSNAWLDIEYEVMVNNMEAEARRLIEFCDLTWDPACLAFYESKRQVRTASFLQVRQPIYTSSVERWRRYEKELAPLIHALTQQSLTTISNPAPNSMHDQMQGSR